MNLSMKWLNDYVDINMPPRDFSEEITMSGTKVESYKVETDKIKNVVVGKVLSLEKHPDADRLIICKIDVGEEEPLQIVTGADNLTENDLVPVAMHKSLLPNGMEIKKGKLRGIQSFGMLCSLEELNLDNHDFPYADEDGILIIKEDCKPGDDIAKVLNIDDTIVEFEITSNRSDCNSMLGLAREVAATFKKDFNVKKPTVKAGNGSAKELLDVKVEEPNLCKMYNARIVKNVKVKPSPLWLRSRLRAVGIRPINNIVDITNYVMLEYGQPMHAFDLNHIKDGKINVRKAKDGEIITTLEGVERKLTKDNLVIADSEKPVALAGVMGGEFSGITDETTTVVFESANFDATNIRTTSKNLNIRTDSSARYEKPLDPNLSISSLERACELVELLKAGDVLDDIISDNHYVKKEHKIKLDPQWINTFISTNLTKDEMVDILERVECKVKDNMVTVPTFRFDLVDPVDLSEEVARFYGYNKIESSSILGAAQGEFSDKQKYEIKIKNTLLGLGMDEITTYSFISPKDYDKVLMAKDDKKRKSVVISNPLGEETSIMRTTTLPSIMNILAKNYNNRNENVALFEVAKEYKYTSKDKLPIENNVISGGLYGEDVDFFSVKGIVEELLNKADITNYDVIADTHFGYHPGRCAKFTIDGKYLGVVGEVHPTAVKNYKIGTKVFSFNFDFDFMYEKANHTKLYKPLPKYPAVNRDLAVICNEEIPVLTLQNTIKKAAGNILEDIKLFDVYKGKQIEKGKKSVAFNITLRSLEATLKEDEINKAINNILKALKKEGAELRLE